MFLSLFIHGKAQSHLHPSPTFKAIFDKKAPSLSFFKAEQINVSFLKIKRKTKGLIVSVPHIANKIILIHVFAPPAFKPALVCQYYSSVLYCTSLKRGPPSF